MPLTATAWRQDAFLEGLFRTAIAAAHPAACLPPHLPPPPPNGRLIVLAAGKAAGSMAEVAEAHYRRTAGQPLAGLAVARHGYGRPTRHIPMIEAGHPVPDAAGLEAAEQRSSSPSMRAPDDLVLVLMSGGASANWIAPARRPDARRQAGGDARAAALRRQHRRDQHGAQASLAHQGRPAGARAQPARVVTLAISDVPGDDPAVIGSGPTVPDPTTLADARAIVARYRLDLPDAVTRALTDPGERNRRSRAIRLSPNAEFKLIARPADAFRAARSAQSRAAGYECVMLGDRIEGEAREVAAEHAAARARLAERRAGAP